LTADHWQSLAIIGNQLAIKAIWAIKNSAFPPWSFPLSLFNFDKETFFLSHIVRAGFPFILFKLHKKKNLSFFYIIHLELVPI
jgi:hypothetical protein